MFIEPTRRSDPPSASRTDEEMRPALRQEGHVPLVNSFFPASRARPSSLTTSGDINAVVTEGTLARTRAL